VVSCIPHNETVVLAGDMNGHLGSSNVGCDQMQGGFEYGDRNADGSKILEFTDGLNLVICNKLFLKQKSQFVTYAAGPVKSTVDYNILWQEDKAKVCNIKVIVSNGHVVHTHPHNCFMDLDFVQGNLGEPVTEERFTHSHPCGHQLSLICFLHLLLFMASSLFNLRA